MPTQPATAAAPPAVTWEQKLTWMTRLEDQRILRDPNPPAPVILRPATDKTPAVIAPPPPSDLIRLLGDSEARVRRRAALAVGRVGLVEGVQPLEMLLSSDEEAEVRQMAAFALGLIGDPSARTALQMSLRDPSPLVQGRAAEALAAIGDKSDAQPIADMVKAQLQSGALSMIEPDDLTYPLAPPVEAARLGLYALARLGAYPALASAVLDAEGMPVSRWWPVAYAFQRVNDPRAVSALVRLLDTPGRYTAAFAVKGLGAQKNGAAAGALRDFVQQGKRDPAVVVEAVRALGAIGDRGSVALLTKLVGDPATDATLRGEAMTAVGPLMGSDAVDTLLDLVTDADPTVRAMALRTLARVDTDSFMSTLAGLDPDRDWTVRVATATALGGVPAERSLPRLTSMLDDRDQRVVPAVIEALSKSKAPAAQRLIVERLKADDFAVREAAAAALAAMKATGTVPEIVAAYRATLGDSTYVARAAMLDAINALDPATARPLLQEALQDRDWAVRVKAATLLRGQGVTQGVAETMRPAPGARPVNDPGWASIVAPPYSPHAFIDTDKGTIEIELAVLDAPLTVANFIALARRGFFDGTAIHRVVPDFVVQDGDPRGDGEGGPGYTIRDELNERPYLRGTVGMALDWRDTGGSQFFITHAPQPHLDARYTAFGTVVDGMDVVDKIVRGDVIRHVRIEDGVTEVR